MKIIKKGREQRGWAKKFKCTGRGNGDGGCGAELLVEKGDLFKTFSHCRDETDVYVTFKCPCCGVLTDLPEREAAYNMLQDLPNQKAWEAAKSIPYER